jgi:hypothetical protein
MGIDKQDIPEMSTIRLSHKAKLRLAKIKARLLLRDGIERSMEELLDLLMDEHEEKEGIKEDDHDHHDNHS